MSRARRRRKGSTILASIAAIPLVAAVSIQELGVVVPPGATASCAGVLSSDIPACTAQDFRSGCSTECRDSVVAMATSLLEACSAALFSDELGPLFSTDGSFLLCSATPSDATTTFVTTLLAEPTDVAPLPSTQLPVEGALPSSAPFIPPFAVPAPSFTAPASQDQPILAPSAPPVVTSAGAPLLPAILLPVADSLGTPPTSTAITQPSQPTDIADDDLLPDNVSTTQAPTISVIVGPPLVGGTLPPAFVSTPPSTLQAPPAPTTLQTVLPTTTLQTSISPSAPNGAPIMSSISQPSGTSSTPSSPPTTLLTSRTPSQPFLSSSPTADAADNGGLGTTTMPTGDQMRRVNPGIIGGVVGGGLLAIVGLTALIYLAGRRYRKAKEERDGVGRRHISSWDFIDSSRNAPPSQQSSKPGMSFMEQPIYYNGMVQDVAVSPKQPAQEVTIKRVSGPPVVVRPSNGNTGSSEMGRPESGLDERTVEALGMTVKSARTKYTASQYSEGNSSIIVGYEAPEPVPQATPNMMYGSPGPTVYRGSTTTVGGGGGGARNYGDGRPRYPTPIDEVPEYPVPQVPMPRRSTFYDPFTGNMMLRDQGRGYGRI